ncbi:MAG: XRE family transcriptional regulator [Cyanobacteriota bacterium ELA615]|jgi:hypothetical protein
MNTFLNSNNIGITIFPPNSQTGNSQTTFNLLANCRQNQTTNSLDSAYQSSISIEDNRMALSEVRKMSGLTWEQLTRIFKVSRRTLHFWASGQSLSRSNEEKLYRILKTIQCINRGTADLTRAALLNPNKDQQIPFDLLVEGRYQEVEELLGVGNAPHKKPQKPLSLEVQIARRPQKPEDLIDALNEPIHREVGRSRPAKAVRVSQSDRTN